jgi:hypothetical protein
VRRSGGLFAGGLNCERNIVTMMRMKGTTKEAKMNFQSLV